MDNNLEIWEKVFQENEWGKYPSLPVIRFIAKNFYKVKDRKEIKILEIGSGSGANLWFCAREGFSVIALEGSQTAIDRMNTRFEIDKMENNIQDVYCGDYLKTLDKIEDSSIDAVIDCESLCCNPFDYSKEVIEKCFQKLKKGGKFLSQTFAEGTWGFEGEECDYHAVIPTSGPLSGKGFNRYTTKDDIEKLYKLETNLIEKVERQEYYHTETNVVKEWVIELKKI